MIEIQLLGVFNLLLLFILLPSKFNNTDYMF